MKSCAESHNARTAVPPLSFRAPQSCHGGLRVPIPVSRKPPPPRNDILRSVEWRKSRYGMIVTVTKGRNLSICVFATVTIILWNPTASLRPLQLCCEIPQCLCHRYNYTVKPSQRFCTRYNHTVEPSQCLCHPYTNPKTVIPDLDPEESHASPMFFYAPMPDDMGGADWRLFLGIVPVIRHGAIGKMSPVCMLKT